MTNVYETAMITPHRDFGPGKRLLEIAYEQGGRHYRRCAACAGFHPVRQIGRGTRDFDGVTVWVTDLSALRGRIPAHLCPYPDRRGRVPAFYARCLAAGEEPPSVGFPAPASGSPEPRIEPLAGEQKEDSYPVDADEMTKRLATLARNLERAATEAAQTADRHRAEDDPEGQADYFTGRARAYTDAANRVWEVARGLRTKP